MTISNDDIRALSTEAGQAGDLEQVEICTAALQGDAEAQAECEKVIRSTRSLLVAEALEALALADEPLSPTKKLAEALAVTLRKSLIGKD